MLHGVSAMPTFLLFRNATKIDMIRGADPAGLEDAIKKWYGEEDEADDSTIAKGQVMMIPGMPRAIPSLPIANPRAPLCPCVDVYLNHLYLYHLRCQKLY